MRTRAGGRALMGLEVDRLGKGEGQTDGENQIKDGTKQNKFSNNSTA